MAVVDGSRVKIAFTATYPDGELFDTSSRRVAVEHGVDAEKRFRPIVVEIGSEPAIESLQAGLLGMEEGETKRIEVPHADLALEYDRAEFESMVGESPTVGSRVHAMTGLLGEVVDVDGETVTIDFDPERAEQVLTFDVEVLEVE